MRAKMRNVLINATQNMVSLGTDPGTFQKAACYYHIIFLTALHEHFTFKHFEFGPPTTGGVRHSPNPRLLIVMRNSCVSLSINV